MNEVIEVDPSEIQVSEYNERKTGVEVEGEGDSLYESVGTHGVIEPPIVRENTDGEYEVVIGQRRVKAAQLNNLEKIHVVVVNWDDLTSLTNSISENIESFKLSVRPSDRAMAIKTMWELMEGEGLPSPREIADSLGVSERTVSLWIEPFRKEWEGTEIQENIEEPTEEDSSEEADAKVLFDELGETKLRDIRLGCKGTDFNIEDVARAVAEEELSAAEVRTLKEYLQQGVNPETAIEDIRKEEEEEKPVKLPTSPIHGTSQKANNSEESEEDVNEDTSPIHGTSSDTDTSDEEEEEVKLPTKEEVASEEEDEELDGEWGEQISEAETEDSEEEDSVEAEESVIKILIPPETTLAVEEAISQTEYESPEQLTFAALQKYLRELRLL